MLPPPQPDNGGLFFCMPRTASGFMRARLQQLLGDGLQIVGHDSYPLDWAGLGFRQASIKPWTFCIVRNPIVRFLSAYRWNVMPRPRNALDQKTRRAIQKYKTFASFCDDLESFAADSENSPVHFHPQYKWITDNDDKLMMDYIGRYEQIEESWKTIATMLDFEYRPLHQRNRGVVKRNLVPLRDKLLDSFYGNAVDDKTRQSILKFYEKDFTIFGYAE